MSRGCIALVWLGLAYASLAPAQQESIPVEEGQLPPEEDKSKIQEQYSFNPVTSKHDVEVGEEYFRKGNFKAAALRFREATKWNDGNAQAWLRLGDAADRLKDTKAAHEAWEKYLQLAPEAKNAAEVRKRLEKLKV